MTWPQYLRRECRVDDFPVSLSGHECEILFVLLVRYPEPVPIADLVEVLYPDSDKEPPAETAENVAMNTMRKLRAKIGGFRIFTRYGYGYRLRQRPDDLAGLPRQAAFATETPRKCLPGHVASCCA